MAYRTPRDIDKERRALRALTIVNASNHTFVDKYNGDVYEFPPMTKGQVPAAAAWLWFGDPDVHPNIGAPDGVKREYGDFTWDRQVRMLAERHGGKRRPYQRLDNEGKPYFVHPDPDMPSAWELIIDGKIWCKELGRGNELYGWEDRKQVTPVSVATEAVTEADLSGETPTNTYEKIDILADLAQEHGLVKTAKKLVVK